jgi:hypothetical protein
VDFAKLQKIGPLVAFKKVIYIILPEFEAEVAVDIM